MLKIILNILTVVNHEVDNLADKVQDVKMEDGETIDFWKKKAKQSEKELKKKKKELKEKQKEIELQKQPRCGGHCSKCVACKCVKAERPCQRSCGCGGPLSRTCQNPFNLNMLKSNLKKALSQMKREKAPG